MTRHCTNCRAVIPKSAEVCPQCGTYAGDVYEGRRPKSQGAKGSAWRLWVALLVIAAGGAGGYYYWRQRHRLPVVDNVHVVRGRPGGERRAVGAGVSEAEAMLNLRRFLRKSYALRDECIAAMSKGFSDGAYVFDTVNRCDGSRLGRWRVDSQTLKVSR